MDSILNTIKKLLGLEESYTHFDTDIIIGINTALSTLTQIGVGPAEGFSISDKTTTWSDYISDMSKLELIKSYIHLKVKLLFDPPSSSALIEVINSQIKELEFRISVMVDTGGQT